MSEAILKLNINKRSLLIKDIQRFLQDVEGTGLDLVRVQLMRNLACKKEEEFGKLQDEIETYYIKKEDENLVKSQESVREDFHLSLENLLCKLDQFLSLYTERSRSTETLSEVHTVVNPNCNRPQVRPKFEPYDPDNETVSNFLIRLDTYFNIISCKDDNTKVLLLLNCLSPKVHHNFCSTLLPSDPRSKSFSELVSVLKNVLEGHKNTFAEQHKFICRVQNDNESIKDYCACLKNLTVDCKFSCDCGKSICEIFLKLQLIRGVKDPEIRQKLLQCDYDLSFDDLIRTAVSIELSKQENKNIESTHKVESFSTYTLNSSKSAPAISKLASSPIPSSFQKRKGPEVRKISCYRCGQKNHKANECIHTESVCHKCDKFGHLASVCRSQAKKKHVNEVYMGDDSQDENEELGDISVITKPKLTDKIFLNVLVDDVPLDMEMDTGAAVSTIAYTDFIRNFPAKKIFKTNLELRTYTGELIKPTGAAYVKIIHKGHTFHAKLYVIKQKVSTILGREWLREMKINWSEDVKALGNDSNLENLLTEFQDIFTEEIECVPNYKVDFQVKENTMPVFIKPRTVPYALRARVEEEIRRLESLNIIEKMENAEWGTPVVPIVKKNGNIRLCADYKVTLNKFVIDDRYPIPRIEDLFMKMRGGKVFCTLDIQQAYLHMGMSETAAKMQTLSTHLGSYKVNRLMFGVKVAPGIWQRFMDSILFDLEGVACFFDDIIIQGKDFEECCNRLHTVLNRLRQNKLTLSKDKCSFFKSSIKYLGHVINEQGLMKSSDKVEAIANAPPPTNQKELKSFLGLLNYYHKFIPDLATKMNPLNSLLKKKEKFIWNKRCEEVFTSIKKEITSDLILMHYDPNLPLLLACDASPVGLGVVLSHKLPDGSEKPIAFASRTLSKSEMRYSQIDKEATGIYWGLRKFYDYLYGRKFTLITDHKPLVSILHPNKMLPNVTASRIFNYAHYLSGFDYDIIFKKTGDHANADFLSRFPVEQCKGDLDLVSVFQINQIHAIPVKFEEIVQHTKEDPSLSKLLKALEEGVDLKTMGYETDQFSLQGGVIFRGQQVWIPKILQKRVLNELHISHLGIVKMKALARSYCYWPGMDRDIELLASSCANCTSNAKEEGKVEIHPWEVPSGPWQRLHIDFAGPIKGQWLFILVDAYSKWTEVISTRSTTSTWVINTLKKLFTSYGLCLTIVSDNGSQFKSHDFESFLSDLNITHLTSAPYHPASNGQAERMVQNVKHSLKKMEDEGGDMESKILKFLVQQRRAPHCTTGISPYEAMFGREIRHTLSLLRESKDVRDTSTSNQTTSRSFKIGDRVQVRNYQANGKWLYGKVKKRIGRVMYLVHLQDGSTCKRHVNQMRKSFITEGVL